jgi:hypothetical protein
MNWKGSWKDADVTCTFLEGVRQVGIPAVNEWLKLVMSLRRTQKKLGKRWNIVWVVWQRSHHSALRQRFATFCTLCPCSHLSKKEGSNSAIVRTEYDYWMVDWTGSGRMLSWPISRYYLSILPEGVRNATINLSLLSVFRSGMNDSSCWLCLPRTGTNFGRVALNIKPHMDCLATREGVTITIIGCLRQWFSIFCICVPPSFC